MIKTLSRGEQVAREPRNELGGGGIRSVKLCTLRDRVEKSKLKRQES